MEESGHGHAVGQYMYANPEVSLTDSQKYTSSPGMFGYLYHDT
jgi:hypothetical protein